MAKKKHLTTLPIVNTNDPIYKQQINYGQSNIRSISDVITRFNEDFNSNFLQNRVISGLITTYTSPLSVSVSIGTAMVFGRWIETDSIETFTLPSTDGTYYIIIKIQDDGGTSETRNPLNDSVTITYVLDTSYNSSTDFIIAKAVVSGGTITTFEEYSSKYKKHIDNIYPKFTSEVNIYGGVFPTSHEKILRITSSSVFIGKNDGLRLFNDGNDSQIKNLIGNFYIYNNVSGKDIIFQTRQKYLFQDLDDGAITLMNLNTDTRVLTLGSSTDKILVKIYDRTKYYSNYFSTKPNYYDDFPLQLAATYSSSQYYPILNLYTENNNPTLPKVGIWALLTATYGSYLYFGTSDNYGTGITKTNLELNPDGSIKNSIDNAGYYTGASNDLRFFHDGTNSVIKNITGTLFITNTPNTSDLVIKTNRYFYIEDYGDGSVDLITLDTEGRTFKFGQSTDPLSITNYTSGRFVIDEVNAASGTSVDLLHLRHEAELEDFVIRFDATSRFWGIYTEVAGGGFNIARFYVGGDTGIYGHLFTLQNGTKDLGKSSNQWRNIYMSGAIYNRKDNDGYYTGASDDLRIYHDGSHSRIINNTGALVIGNTFATDDIVFRSKQLFRFEDYDDSTALLLNLDTNNRKLEIGTSVDPIDIYLTKDIILSGGLQPVFYGTQSGYGMVRFYRDDTIKGESSIGFARYKTPSTSEIWVVGVGGWLGAGLNSESFSIGRNSIVYEFNTSGNLILPNSLLFKANNSYDIASEGARVKNIWLGEILKGVNTWINMSDGIQFSKDTAVYSGVRTILGFNPNDGMTDWRLWWAPRKSDNSGWDFGREFGFDRSTGNWYVETKLDAYGGIETTEFTSSINTQSNNMSGAGFSAVSIEYVWDEASNNWVTNSNSSSSIHSFTNPVWDSYGSAENVYQIIARNFAKIKIEVPNVNYDINSLGVGGTITVRWYYTYDGGTTWLSGGSYSTVYTNATNQTTNFDNTNAYIYGKNVTGDVLVKLTIKSTQDDIQDTITFKSPLVSSYKLALGAL